MSKKNSGYQKRSQIQSRSGLLSDREAEKIIGFFKVFDYKGLLDYTIPSGDNEYSYKIKTCDPDDDNNETFTNKVESKESSHDKNKFSSVLLHDYTNQRILAIDLGDDLPAHRNIKSGETIQGAHFHVYKQDDRDYAIPFSKAFPGIDPKNKIMVSKELLKYANVKLDDVNFEEDLI